MSRVAKNLALEPSLFLKVSTHPIRQQAEEGRHLSSYTEDSLCHSRPLLLSDTEGALQGSERVLFCGILNPKTSTRRGAAEEEGGWLCLLKEGHFVNWHPTWRSLCWQQVAFSAGACPVLVCNKCSQGTVPPGHSQRSCFWTAPSQKPFLIMPNQQKKIIFCVAGVLSFVCALGVVTALGTPLWVKATILCKTGALLVNASGKELDKFTGEMQYGLFHGEGVRQCGLGDRPFQFSSK